MNMLGEEEVSIIINVGIIFQFNWIFGVVQIVFEGMGVVCEEVCLMIWQIVILKKIKGNIKDWVCQFCDMFNIIGKNVDVCDVVVIVIWVVGWSQ